MSNFSFYEQAGIIVPGAMLVLVLLLLFPDIRTMVSGDDFSIADLGVFLLVAYPAGHLVAAAGNALEEVWWRLWGGMPSHWVTKTPPGILTATQVTQLSAKLQSRLGLPATVAGLPAREWRAIHHHVYRDVLANNPGRIEQFNGNYGLNRGVAVTLFAAAIGVAVTSSPIRWWLVALLIALSGIYLWRMHRFARYLAREVLTGFLNIK